MNNIIKISGFKENNNFWKAVEDYKNFNNMGIEYLSYDMEDVIFYFKIKNEKEFFLIKLKYGF
jgi:hypothetical protein